MEKLKKNLKNFYKKIIKDFFKFLYGDIKGKISHSDSKDIVLIELEIDKNNYKIYNCKDCSLYTDTIHNTAIIKKGKIVNGPSFQLRNNINVDCMNNSVISSGTPRFKKKITGKIASFLTGGGGNSNYWHWMYDVLPRLKIIEKKTVIFFVLGGVPRCFSGGLGVPGPGFGPKIIGKVFFRKSVFFRPGGPPGLVQAGKKNSKKFEKFSPGPARPARVSGPA